ncbi:cell division protein FtsW [Corynebacterium lizhenjunii]|uniref:Probable peptidoglycan glycosyltransferase FtsW n=1 Tax=Corynebacterium lizhenjunii TaxID=2709394 RepID=A0A7T0PD36_9CORY|nr:putative peptidoglycan glycosyltransferase FtsW [Corynebacterium lizhenjunii]QPK80367.1 cell division protein FtsW [Corynebacterium lizhenjunii]
MLSNDSPPGLDYVVLRIVIFSLIGIGVLMAFSASMATSQAESGTFWGEAIRQVVMVAFGLVMFWLALRTPPRVIRKYSGAFLLLSIVLLIVVLTPLGTGRDSVGSQSWIDLGPVSIQPSEIARIAIALYGAAVLAGQRFGMHGFQTFQRCWRDAFVRYSAVATLMLVLIVAQGDMGMAASFAIVAGFTLFFAGINSKVFLILVPFVLAGVIWVFSSGGFRSARFHTFFDALTGHIADTQEDGYQTYQGFLSLADGGVAGVGLGQSRAKWSYLPEARNDFVFAIVGEELGLWGGLLVIVLFAALLLFGIRTAMRAQTQFQALAAATLTTAVVSQAFFNISYVIGLLPVTGIQLPMISAGGSAAVVTIGAMGILCNIARHEPEQVSAMQNYGRPLFDRLLWIPEPEPIEDAPRPKGGRRRADGTGRPRSSRPQPEFGPAVTQRRSGHPHSVPTPRR